MKLKKKRFDKKGFKTKQLSIKKVKTIFDIKINWNQVLRDRNEKQIQLRKEFKTK